MPTRPRRPEGRSTFRGSGAFQAGRGLNRIFRASGLRPRENPEFEEPLLEDVARKIAVGETVEQALGDNRPFKERKSGLGNFFVRLLGQKTGEQLNREHASNVADQVNTLSFNALNAQGQRSGQTLGQQGEPTFRRLIDNAARSELGQRIAESGFQTTRTNLLDDRVVDTLGSGIDRTIAENEAAIQAAHASEALKRLELQDTTTNAPEIQRLQILDRHAKQLEAERAIFRENKLRNLDNAQIDLKIKQLQEESSRVGRISKQLEEQMHLLKLESKLRKEAGGSELEALLGEESSTNAPTSEEIEEALRFLHTK